MLSNIFLSIGHVYLRTQLYIFIYVQIFHLHLITYISPYNLLFTFSHLISWKNTILYVFENMLIIKKEVYIRGQSGYNLIIFSLT